MKTCDLNDARDNSAKLMNFTLAHEPKDRRLRENNEYISTMQLSFPWLNGTR